MNVKTICRATPYDLQATVVARRRKSTVSIMVRERKSPCDFQHYCQRYRNQKAL
jgi:hypothetical protein